MEQSQDAQAEARAAIENDEVALRIRALGVAIVTAISTMDKKSKRVEPRDAFDPLFLIMEASLDVVDMTLREQRKTREALDNIAMELRNHNHIQSALLQQYAKPPVTVESSLSKQG